MGSQATARPAGRGPHPRRTRTSSNLLGGIPIVRLKEFSHEDQHFVDALNEAQRRADTLGRIPEPRTGYWPSEALYQCLRQKWLAWFYEPTDVNSNLDTFAIGNNIEQSIVQKFQQAGIVLRTQEHMGINDPRLTRPISGRIDLLILEGEDIITPVEIKSTKDYGEDSGYEKWKNYLPHEEHAAQLTLYMKARKADHGYIAYMNKNRSLLAVYRVDFNVEFYDFIIETFMEFEKSLLGPEPPMAKGMKQDKFPCGWGSRAPDAKSAGKLEGTCQFWSHCYKGQELKKLVQ